MPRNTEIIHLTIPSSAEGKNIKEFLMRELRFSMHQVSRVKYRPAGFRVNGISCIVTEILHKGDILSFAADDAEYEAAEAARSRSCSIQPDLSGKAPKILFEDDYLLIADKPSGMVSHPSHGHHGDSALDLLTAAHGRLYLVGRLDKDTSGILLFAKHKETASLLSRQKDTGVMKKTYLARVCGSPEPSEGVIDAPIGIEQEFPLKMKTGAYRAKAAVTHYETIQSECVAAEETQNCPVSILRVTIDHGRTHQIRVHLSSSGWPVIGDKLYGKSEAEAVLNPSGQLCLHASEITLLHPYCLNELRIRAADPVWMNTPQRCYSS